MPHQVGNCFKFVWPFSECLNFKKKRSAAIVSADFSANLTITGQFIYLSPLCYAVEAHLLCVRANR